MYQPMKLSTGRGSLIVLSVVTILVLVIVSNFATKIPVFVAGEVVLEEDQEMRAKGMRTLFVTLFDAERPVPMPYGAAKFLLADDPKPGKFFKFSVTVNNLQIMNPNRPQPQKLRVKVRLDADGMGGPDQPADLVGELASVALGSENLTLTLKGR